ncbi:MAG TPA: hypothetical protein P5132_07480 [Bacteroidales bacterium]|nr:hypothetical protein [Bacteroidales bacterium]
MEPCSINLNQMSDKGSRYKRLLLILALIFLVTSALTFWLLSINNNPNEWIFLGLGVYFLLFIYFGYVGYNAKMFINCDDFALEYQFGFFSKVPDKIIWETLTKVKLGFTYVAFYKKTGKRKLIQVGWLPYQKVKEIKNKVHEICNEKGIQVEVVEYHYEEEFENEEEK